ncbi:MAG: formyl transferase [Acidobacteria bacterium]|nr:formyl transferase [Acidobacteriota bacterium]
MRPRAILLTSTFLRHLSVARRVSEDVDLQGVWCEAKSFEPQRYGSTADEHAAIAAHFAARDRSEDAFFAGCRDWEVQAQALLRKVGPGGVNDPEHVDAMARLQPDVVLVFGTGILKPPIIARFGGRIINLHLGLSPYYRGAGTNFWPLVNREPEYVGATIHYLDAGIDTGPIIAHVRPQIAPDDGPHDVGNKAIIAAADTLARAAVRYARGGVASVPQTGGGRLYYRKHFSADAVHRLYENFRTGMISEYLADKTRRDAVLDLRTLAD